MVRFRKLYRAIAPIYLHNRELCRTAAELRNFYIYGAEMPPCEKALSVALKCERNGAHSMLEAVLSEAKRIGRGNLPPRAIEYWLARSSERLLDELRQLICLLPTCLTAQADAVRNHVEIAREIENRLTNFLLKRSGAGEDIQRHETDARIDRLLDKMKSAFNCISRGFDDVEMAIMRQSAEVGKPSACRRRKGGRHPADDIKAKDRRAIIVETRRRYQAKLDKGIATDLKCELMRLYSDPAWERRCHQWRSATLYSYLVREGLQR